MMETWLPIDSHYDVSDAGNVRKVSGEMVGQWANGDGYMMVRLSKPRRMLRVHRLVAEAFIPNESLLPFVNHIDCNPANNSASNLEWCTQEQNIAHSERLGRMQRNFWAGKRSPNAALTEDQVKIMRDLYAQGGIALEPLGKRFGVSKRCAGRVINREVYKDVR